MKLINFFLICLLIPLLLSPLSCTYKEREGNFNMSTLRVGFFSYYEEKKVIRARYAPLLDHFSRRLGIPVEFHFTSTSDDLYEKFLSGQIDLALFNGTKFLKASYWDKAVPLVIGDTQCKSSFIVRGDNPVKEISGLNDVRFSFGSMASAPDHWMPRLFLNEMDIAPEKFFSTVAYSGGHYETILAVRGGSVDVGVVDSEFVQKAYATGALNKKEVRVLFETPEFSNRVWALNPFYTRLVRNKIRSAFLNLSPKNKAHEKILANIGVRKFMVPAANIFSRLQKALKLMPKKG